jgi:DNA-binding response OmpR family regulator
MKIASLFLTPGLEDYALAACRDDDEGRTEVSRFHELSALLAALRWRNFEALVVEDDEHELPHWLAALHLRTGAGVPTIVFGAGGAEGMARALQRGADEYATHSEGPAALLQRVRARVQQRAEQRQVRRLQAGACSLDANSRCLKHEDHEVSLTAREFALAWALFYNLGRVVTFHTLSNEIWGRSSDIGKRTIEQHVYKLRRKMGSAAGAAQGLPNIQAVYGVGYRLQLGQECAA